MLATSQQFGLAGRSAALRSALAAVPRAIPSWGSRPPAVARRGHHLVAVRGLPIGWPLRNLSLIHI
eukprot:11516082-Alexandrium_andersonii.AAC.1